GDQVPGSSPHMKVRVKGEAKSGVQYAGGCDDTSPVRQRSSADCLTLTQFLLSQADVIDQGSRCVQVPIETIDVTARRQAAIDQSGGQMSSAFQPDSIRIRRLIELRRGAKGAHAYTGIA